MNWFKKIIALITSKILKLMKDNVVAKIILENLDGSPIEFDISDLLYISYDSETDCLVLSLLNKQPIYIPLSKGNVDFFLMISPYFKNKSGNDPKLVADKVGTKPKVKF